MTLPLNPKSDQPIVWVKNVALGPHREGQHIYDPDAGIHTILLKPRAGVRTRVHELKHAQLGHMGYFTVNELIHNETSVIREVDKILGPRGTPGSIHMDLVPQVVSFLLEKGYRSNPIYVYVLKRLEKEGYRYSTEGKKELWRYIQERYRKYRKQVRGEV